MSRPATCLSISLLTLIACLIGQQAAVTAAETATTKVEFNRDIRPILSDKCFVCHGPDSAKRKADLRLDQRDSAITRHGDSAAIVPGDASGSELIHRIASHDPDLQMPPPASTLKLSATEVSLLKRWIDQGAQYQPHWAFIPPQASSPPATGQSAGIRNQIDSFIRHRLDQEGLIASGDADKTTLIRRISFDLTGLPPHPDDVAEFVADNAPDAFERLIDRLLASPRYGERMAANWLDAARFADTNGYQTDGPRFMWRWRDWVINAFNQNQPFDEFTIDQLAGDLLEEQSASDQLKRTSVTANARLIATGFNRNHRGNAEGGIIPEEFRVEYVVDRVETTAAVWLGLTVGCARCHDHKYDPISQREFYQLFAFFNQVPEPGKYIRNDNSMPYLPAPTPDQQRTLTTLEQEREAANSDWQAMSAEVQAGVLRLAAQIQAAGKPLDWNIAAGLDSHLAFEDDVVFRPAAPASPPSVPGKAASQPFVWKGGEAKFVPGRVGRAVEFDGKRWIESVDAGDFGEDESFAISCWVRPTGSGAMTILARMDHDNSSRGYELRREADGRLHVLFSGRILDDLIRVETATSIPANVWSHIFVTYDGSSAARGVTVQLNGQREELKVITDLLSNPIRVKLPLSVGAGGSAPQFVGQIDDLRFYRGRLTAQAALSLAAGDTISEIASRPIDSTTPPAHLEKLRQYYLAEHASAEQRRVWQHAITTREQYAAYLATIPTTMVMQDQQRQRETRMLKRGEYDKPGDRVEPGLPSALQTSRLPASGQRKNLDRLVLAQWLVSRQNPLTARVTVNRLWQSFFGVGLVKTAEDFGTQGESPSHPELLDWLAVEFRGSIDPEASSTNPRSGRPDSWNVKRLLRQIITSATYRQDAQGSETLFAKDPDNRWLARGPRFRLPAEMIRDAVLSSSGLLVESLGGPSVKPYQPPGLWEELSAEAVPGPFAVYVQDHGPNLYRRGIYTFRKRTVPPPSLAIFDASPREACRVSLPRTNTPLQALNLMNDVTYVEAARVLATQAMKEGGASAPSRLTWVFRRVLARDPSDSELKVLVDGFERRRRAYESRPHAVHQLLNLGETRVDGSLVAHELAAYTATTSVIFNIDEFVAKP